MTLRIEDHPSYDKSIPAIQREMTLSLRSKLSILKATLKMLNSIRREIGLGGLFGFLRALKQKADEALEQHDFSALQARGLSDSDLREIIERTVLAQEMVKALGLEKAKTIRVSFIQSVAKDLLGGMYPTREYLEQCEDGFWPNYKQFIRVYVAANNRDGVQSGTISEPSPDQFFQDMNYCAYVEIAQTMGALDLCEWNTCIYDDFFFPEYMSQAGCQYTRTGVLARGAPVCDFHWTRVRQEEE